MCAQLERVVSLVSSCLDCKDASFRSLLLLVSQLCRDKSALIELPSLAARWTTQYTYQDCGFHCMYLSKQEERFSVTKG